MQDGYETLLSLLPPDFILEFFEMKGVRKEDDILHLDLEEINVLPKVKGDGKLISKGFFPTITNQGQNYGSYTMNGFTLLLKC